MAMSPQIARNLAYERHLDERDRTGGPIVDHLERVAAAVPPDARTVAFLHDVLEHTGTSADELRAQGLTDPELGAVRLLTRAPDETFELHALRIAHAKGSEGCLARTVKLADMADHVAHDGVDMPARPYGWARRHIAACQERADSVQRSVERPNAILPSSRTAPNGLAGIVAAGEAPG
jgi:hypothetical protein